jgi:hypothetical protein
MQTRRIREVPTCEKGPSRWRKRKMHTQVVYALVARNRFDVPRNPNDLIYIQS